MTHQPRHARARRILPARRLGRARSTVAVLTAAAVLVVPALAAGALAAGRADAGKVLMCRRYQHVAVRTSWGARYVVKNDNYAGKPECLTVRGRWPNFTVTLSGARGWSREPRAYPFVLYGCSWGTCSRGSALPRQVSALNRPAVTWDTSQAARGRWDAAFDIWFGKQAMTTGQADGGEVMVWLNARGVKVPRHTRVVDLAGTRWFLEHWRTCHGGVCWHYTQFRRVVPVEKVRGLQLSPFIARAEASGWVRRRWWLESIDAGFEIWRGGTGLATDWFSARA